MTKDTKNVVESTGNSMKEESAADKLNRLLASMSTDHGSSQLRLQQKISCVPVPGSNQRRKKLTLKAANNKNDIYLSVKQVAQLFVKEKQQTEEEIICKLQESYTNTEAMKNFITSEFNTSETNLNEIITGMKIDRHPQPNDEMSMTRQDYAKYNIILARNRQQQQQKQFNDRRPPWEDREYQTRTKPERATITVDLFGSEPLGIFTNSAVSKEEKSDPAPQSMELNTYSQLQNQYLKLQITHPTRNYFEKMVIWTEEGRVWPFPINNEQNWREEIDIDFSEHIFLEQHLDSWCPNQGPIRHFMELVCVGLSKNPYITAKDKKAHILWYRDYFQEKRTIIQDLVDKQTPSIISKN